MSVMLRLAFLAVRAAVALACVWCALIEIAEAAAGRLFSMELDGDWFLLLAASSERELSDFFSLYTVPLAVCLCGFFFLSVVFVTLSFRLPRRAFIGFGLLLIVYAAVEFHLFGKTWKPLYVAFDTFRSTAQYYELIQAGEWTAKRAELARPPSAGATNLVLVIGESLTSDRMGLYGYPRNTTPLLSSMRDQVAVLGPVGTSEPYTARSLRKMLSQATVDCPRRAVETLPVTLRMKGYRTALVSAQDHWERYCGVEQMIFAACETRIYRKDIKPDGELYDEDLLPIVRKVISEDDGRPFAVFVHLQGSHFEPGDRVPPGFATDEDLDDYDRSVRYTDRVLAMLIKAIPERTLLIFVSDHGESTDCPGWRDLSSRSLWRVPLLVFPFAEGKRFATMKDVGELWYNLKDI